MSRRLGRGACGCRTSNQTPAAAINTATATAMVLTGARRAKDARAGCAARPAVVPFRLGIGEREIVPGKKNAPDEHALAGADRDQRTSETRGLNQNWNFTPTRAMRGLMISLIVLNA